MATSIQTDDFRALLVRQCKTALSSDFTGKVAETYLVRVLLMGITLVTTVVVARLLGPQGRGYYAVAVATGALGVQFGTMGLHASNSYFVAKQPESLPLLTGNSLAVSFGFGGLIALILGGFFTLRPELLDIRGTTLLLALLWIPFGLAYLLMQSLMLGVHDVRGYNLAEIGSKVIPLVLMGGLVLAGRITVGLFFSTTLFAMVVNCLWVAARLRSRFPVRPQLSLALFRTSIHYALKAYVAGALCFLVLRADLFMVQHMLGPVQAGYYSIASSMADVVSVLAVVIGLILFPKLSALDDIGTKLRLTYKIAWVTAAALFPILAIGAVLAKWAVQLLFGVAFLPASQAFVLLMPGMLFLGVESVAVQFLNSIGYPKIVIGIWLLCSVFNITLNLWAIPQYGILGASVVSSISYFMAFFFIMWVIYRTGRRLGPAIS